MTEPEQKPSARALRAARAIFEQFHLAPLPIGQEIEQWARRIDQEMKAEPAEVPAASMRKALEQYADFNNWSVSLGNKGERDRFQWQQQQDGWWLAVNALAQAEDAPRPRQRRGRRRDD